MQPIARDPNPDLVVGEDRRPAWNRADGRRRAFHQMHRLTRYGARFRAAAVMRLEEGFDPSIAMRDDVRRLSSLPPFSALIVVRGSRILHEQYAADFGPHQPHSIMSVSKMSMNLAIGQQVAQGRIDCSARVERYLPWIGRGYAGATVQDVLDMNVNNDYTEDYHDPASRCFAHEAATGFRLPAPGQPEGTSRSFVASIDFAPGCDDTLNRSGSLLYKSANTDVLAFILEAVSGRPTSQFMADLADAAGFEGSLDVAADREGFTMPDGGISLTARDLARYGLLVARQGRGIDAQQIGSPAFIQATLAGGVPWLPPRQRLRYCNQASTNGRWIGHGGFGGQFLLIDLTTGTVGAFLSVLEDPDGYDADYYVPVIDMLESIACRERTVT